MALAGCLEPPAAEPIIGILNSSINSAFFSEFLYKSMIWNININKNYNQMAFDSFLAELTSLPLTFFTLYDIQSKTTLI